MDKLLWVLTPVVLAGAALAVLGWRGRLPSRPVLNALFSLFLMVYLLVTAGLGIFWVAQQHLPVFDWHYVFGYAMLVLLAVHLAFNFRVLWQTLRRRQRDAPGASPAPFRAAAHPPRRPWLGALGLLGLGSALGTAYWVGLRQGRTELRVVAGGAEAAAAPATRQATAAAPAGTREAASAEDAAAAATAKDAAAAAKAVVLAFHEFSSQSRAGVFRRAASGDWGARPPPFKTLRGATALALPPPLQARAEGLFTLQGLATLLWHTAGISQHRGGIAFRTAPSSGALFAAEFYLAVRAAPGVPGMPAGLWHYQPQTATLVLLRAGVPTAALLPAGAPAALLATALWRRSGHKYGDRCYRYVLADLGHALENARQVAAALGGSATLLPQFDEAALAGLLGIDEASEGVLAQMLLFGSAVQVQRMGLPAHAGRAAPPLPTAQGTEMAATESTVQTAPQAGSAALGVTEAIHRATSLRGAQRWAASPLPRPAFLADTVADPLPLIAARRSHRRFSNQPLNAGALTQVLAAMTAPPAQLSAAVRLHVLTLAVQGHEPAAWQWHATQQRLVHTHRLGPSLREARAQARAAALGQDVVGDAAALVVLSLHRATFSADPAGAARGYRHAFIEIGLLGERLYLQAQALGLGACAVGAFYDDEAAALVGTYPEQEWVVHFAALGVRADGGAAQS